MPSAPRFRSFNQPESTDCSVDGKALLISANIWYHDLFFILFCMFYILHLLLFIIFYFPPALSLVLSAALVFEQQSLRRFFGSSGVLEKSEESAKCMVLFFFKVCGPTWSTILQRALGQIELSFVGLGSRMTLWFSSFLFFGGFFIGFLFYDNFIGFLCMYHLPL